MTFMTQNLICRIVQKTATAENKRRNKVDAGSKHGIRDYSTERGKGKEGKMQFCCHLLCCFTLSDNLDLYALENVEKSDVFHSFFPSLSMGGNGHHSVGSLESPCTTLT